MGEQFHFYPELYLELMVAEVPAYLEFQDVVAVASGNGRRSILDLGVGIGETTRRLLERHPDAALIGIDESDEVLAAAASVVPGADLRRARLEDPLPEGPFDLVASAFCVHHLDGRGKADLFVRLHRIMSPGGRLVIGDVVVPEDPADAVTPLDAELDRPSTIDEQLGWLGQAGFSAEVVWRRQDLVVMAADR